MSDIQIDGVVSIIPTPYREDESIDNDALRHLVDFAIEAKNCAVCLPAYSSEFYKLSDTERVEVVTVACEQAGGRLPIFAQANHGSARVATDLARRLVDVGADAISFALPRQFPLPENDLLRYCESVSGAVSVPVLVQDFNPGGATIGAGFAKRLVESCPNFQWLKLEQPMTISQVEEIRNATLGRIGVLQGWGGLHMMELICPMEPSSRALRGNASGICGVMPSLSISDILGEIFRQMRAGCVAEAHDLFEALTPYLVFSLRNLELHLHVEKRTLRARGLLENTAPRNPCLTLEPGTVAQADLLIGRVVVLAEKIARQG